MPPLPRLYFAYGSNLCREQMRTRCPDSRLHGPARLPKHRWLITHRGHASVAPDTTRDVHGLLWQLSPSDEAALDRFEDVALGEYLKHDLTVATPTGPITALVYIDSLNQPGTPSPEYISRINRGLATAGLDPNYVATQIRPWIPAD